MRDRKNISIIGLSSKQPNIKYYHCPIHQGARLLPSTDENMFMCPECGIPYNPSNVKSDTHITSRFSTRGGQPRIVSGHNRSHKDKEYYDKFGNKLPKDDPDIIHDIAAGHTIISYHTTEDTFNKDKEFTYVKKR